MEENEINVELLLLRYAGEEISWKERKIKITRDTHIYAQKRDAIAWIMTIGYVSHFLNNAPI